VRQKVDLIFTFATQTALAVKKETTVIPIVFTLVGDPVGSGLVASLARPGGNITGLSAQHADTAGKRLELLREVLPNLRRLAVMVNVTNPGPVLDMRQTEAAARMLGIEVIKLEIRNGEDIAAALKAIEGRAQALYVTADAMLNSNRNLINSWTLRAHLPTMHGFTEIVAAGGLMSYAPNYLDLFRRSAEYVSKILHGTNPGSIPVEQPTKFELVVNLKTAKMIGLTIPESFLLRADEVIE
jgi:putative ABC transport system substrate-binding protein